jgi:hypothetical protein
MYFAFFYFRSQLYCIKNKNLQENLKFIHYSFLGVKNMLIVIFWEEKMF